jgi:hypothetical protein
MGNDRTRDCLTSAHAERVAMMTDSAGTKTAPARDIDLSALPPMPPKILESHLKMWRDPHTFDHLEVGDEGLGVAMHGEEIVATNSSLREVQRAVADYGPDEILMLRIPPDDIVEIF